MERTIVSLPRTAVLTIALVLIAAPIASAQTPAPTAPATASNQAQLPGVPEFARLLQGKNVWITKADGFRRQGRVMSLSAAGMVFSTNGSSTTVPFDQIIKVERSSRRLQKGALAGLIAGGGFGLVLGLALCEGECAGWEPVAISGLYGGLGAAAGVGIGALVHAARRNGDVLYEAPPRTLAWTMSPILSPTRKGLAFSVTWR